MKYSVAQIGILWIIFLINTGVLAQENMPTASYEAYLRDHRAQKDSMFLGEHSPLKPEMIPHFQGLIYYPTSQNYQVKAQLKIFKKPQKIIIQKTKGNEETYLRYGQLNFILNGESYTLTAFQREKDLLIHNPMANKRLFIPFRDLTNGQETYAGGRYMDLQIPLIGKELTLDFNLAYNPYCAYNSEYACPIPPVENTLSIPIRAGEKVYVNK